MGNTCCKFSWLTDCKYVVNHDGGERRQVVCDSASFPNHFHFIGQPNVSVQCLMNPKGEDGIVVSDSGSYPIQHIIQPNVPVQCLENPKGEDGVMLIGHESFPI